MIPDADTTTSCLLCGETLKGGSFIVWYCDGANEHIGLHLACAYRLSIGILKDLATGNALETAELAPLLANVAEQ